MREETYVSLQVSIRYCYKIKRKLELVDKLQYSSPESDFMKIPSAVIELLHAHRWTDRRMAKLIGSLLHLFVANPPKISESFNVELRFPSHQKGNTF
jgi:hypothetical protein